MKVERTHHVDAGERGADNMYDYFYEYDLYRFSDGSTSFVVRSYKHEPQAAHFLGVERDGKCERLKVKDLRQPLFLEAVNYLRGIGKQDLSWLSGRGSGYTPVLPST